MPHPSLLHLGQLAYLAVIALSVWRGGAAERAAAIGLTMELVISPMLNHRHMLDPEYGIFALDIVVLAGLLLLALNSDRRWILWAAAFQLLAVLAHLARIIDPTVNRWAYLTTTILWGYAVVAAVLTGTLQVMFKRHAENQARGRQPV